METELSKGVPSRDAGPARDLARRLGEWPLALELATAMMRDRVRLGNSAGHAAARLVAIIERKGYRGLQDPTAERRHRTISNVLEVSLELLNDADRRRLAELSIFPEDVAIPLAAAASVWELDELDAEDLAQLLARLSLVKLDLQRGILRLHDVMRSWLAGDLGAGRELHERLVNAWPDWRNLPELPGEYAWRWLPWHLVQAERKQDLERILWNPEWMQPKLKATDVNALIADYEYLKPSAEISLVQGALRLSSHVVAADEGQFVGQMTGRLVQFAGRPEVRDVLERLVEGAPSSCFRSLCPSLTPPGQALLLTLGGHTDSVNAVTVYAGGRLAISASSDKTLKVWDLDKATELRTLVGHAHWVTAVGVYAEGRRAVSASADNTLKVWDLDLGVEKRTLSRNINWVTALAVDANGRRLISASGNRTLKEWDLETGANLKTLRGLRSAVRDVAFLPDRSVAISASAHILHVWDLETGTERSLTGHTDAVNAVAVYAGGLRAISASSDKTLKVWDLEAEFEVRTLIGHNHTVTAVAVDRDGRRAISASLDRTVLLWDLESGEVIATFTADAPVLACEIVADTVIAGDALGCVHILRIVERSK